MVLTRSQENLNLLDVSQPANVSFSVNSESESNAQTASSIQETRPRGRGRNVHNGTTERQNNIDVRQMISESLENFRSEMSSLITNEIRTVFQNMNINSNNTNNISNNNTSPSVSQNRDILNPSPRNNANDSQEPFFAEKVLNIIRNWRLKFSGHDNEMSVDEFIYRVNILTTNNLKGDFELLCKHAHSLFEGKALVWFWRFHRQQDDIDWITLTNELRKQYKVDYNDFDILEDIRRRRQKPHENFDEYLDVISSMTDKLKNSLSDQDICEILIRNLKSEVRHELLHLEIHSVAHLRREVKKHEKFVKEFESRKITKGHISELTELDENNKDNEICAIQSNYKCWNCDKIGHSYHDCMDKRSIFCYGCGLKDNYKPTCVNCNKKQQGNLQKDVRRK